MFQFSEDLDEEDFLSVPLDGRFIDNEEKCTNESESTDGISKYNQINTEFNGSSDFPFELDDDDDLILSVTENVVSRHEKKIIITDDDYNRETPKIKLIEPVSVSHSFEVTRNGSSSICNSVPAPYINRDNTSEVLRMFTNDLPSPHKISRIEYERKFPGPAGLIPKKSRDNISSNTTLNDSGVNQQLCVHVCDDSIFDGGPWQELIKDINYKSCELLKIINDYTVAAVKRMNIIKHMSRRLPLFAAVVVHVDCSLPDPSVTLKDLSGEIPGTLHKDLWKEYGHLLTVGNALLLRQVSVLSITNSRKLYLNITSKNVDTIYSVCKGGAEVFITRVAPVAVVQTLFDKLDKNHLVPTQPPASKSDSKNISQNLDNPFRREGNEIIPGETSAPNTLPYHATFNHGEVATAPVALQSSSTVTNELDGIDASMFDDFGDF